MSTADSPSHRLVLIIYEGNHHDACTISLSSINIAPTKDLYHHAFLISKYSNLRPIIFREHRPSSGGQDDPTKEDPLASSDFRARKKIETEKKEETESDAVPEGRKLAMRWVCLFLSPSVIAEDRLALR
jgi:hypothetical protein